MQLEWLGAITLLCGLVGWFAGIRFTMVAFLVAMLLGAGAALTVTALGSANIRPAHLLLAFLVLAAFSERERLAAALGTMLFPRAGFWLLLTAIYALLSALFFPRLFAGETYVFAITRTPIGPGITLQPLVPTSGNVTQTIYFIGDVVCFLVVYSYTVRLSCLKAIVHGILACTLINLVFAVTDLITYFTNTAELMSFLRNANYRMLDEATMGGFKRIVGSFPEASSFAYTTVGWFAFCLSLALSGVYRRMTATLSFLTFCALVFATSSTGYFGTAAALLLVWASGVAQLLTRPIGPARLGFVLAAPLLITAAVMALALHEPAWQTVTEMFDTTVLNKLSSDSGLERTRWTAQALVNLAETDGLGAGTGSVRASSFPVAVLGNIGVFGAFTYGAFLIVTLLNRRRRWADPFGAAVQNAARYACAAQLAAASVSGSFIDLDLPFFVFAALACSGHVAGQGSVRSTLPYVAARHEAPFGVAAK